MIKNLRPKLAEAGKIKIGGLGAVRKAKGGREYRLPEKYDHFLITDTIRNDAGDLAVNQDLMEAIGTDTDKKLRAIPIVLHSDEIDEVFPTSYALYSGRRCACRGDGETAIRRELDKDKRYTGNTKKIACPCDFLNASRGPVCKPNGKLYCSIAVEGASVAGAVHIWRTTSIISIEQMIGSLLQIKSICGTLRGVPLWLRVKPITVEPPGQGAITVYVCHVELRAADIAQIQARALEEQAARAALGYSDREYRALLTTPGDGEDEHEQAAVQAEFYPEETQEAATPETPDAPAKPDKTNVPKKGTSPADLAAMLEERKNGLPSTDEENAGEHTPEGENGEQGQDENAGGAKGAKPGDTF